MRAGRISLRQLVMPDQTFELKLCSADGDIRTANGLLIPKEVHQRAIEKFNQRPPSERMVTFVGELAHPSFSIRSHVKRD